MSIKIGFTAEDENNEVNGVLPPPDFVVDNQNIIKKSVVDVIFPACHKPLSYYNDKFNLKKGDIVFVEGKFEGVAGRVVDVNFTFKIKISDYKRIVSVADTDIKGEFKFVLSELLTLDSYTIPYEKISRWFGLDSAEDEFVSSVGDESYDLYNLGTLHISPVIAERGHDYFLNDNVLYVEFNKGNVKAIVKGTEYYNVEFKLNNGMVSGLLCNCYCTGICKHCFAVLLQIRALFDEIYKLYGENFAFDYFAAVNKALFYDYVLTDKEEGTLVVS